jgi:hypothetical protein
MLTLRVRGAQSADREGRAAQALEASLGGDRDGGLTRPDAHAAYARAVYVELCRRIERGG